MKTIENKIKNDKNKIFHFKVEVVNNSTTPNYIYKLISKPSLTQSS
jgi:hypothetical protein